MYKMKNKKEMVVTRAVITAKTQEILKAYKDAKRRRFNVKTSQEEAIDDLLQMAIPKAEIQILNWDNEMKVPEIK